MLKIDEKKITFDEEYYKKITKEGAIYTLPLPLRNRDLTKSEIREICEYIMDGKSKKYICVCFNLSDHFLKSFFQKNFNTNKIAEVKEQLKSLKKQSFLEKNEESSLHNVDIKK